MMDVLSAYYLWFKAFHVMAVIAWMAALLYLPRLFVYHTEARVGDADYQRFLVMERRLLKGIMNPAMVVSVAIGLVLVMTPGVWGGAGWLHAKFLLVFCLVLMHILFGSCYVAFKHNANTRSRNFFRCVNEIPAVLMVGIVILAVVKPF